MLCLDVGLRVSNWAILFIALHHLNSYTSLLYIVCFQFHLRYVSYNEVYKKKLALLHKTIYTYSGFRLTKVAPVIAIRGQILYGVLPIASLLNSDLTPLAEVPVLIQNPIGAVSRKKWVSKCCSDVSRSHLWKIPKGTALSGAGHLRRGRGECNFGLPETAGFRDGAERCLLCNFRDCQTPQTLHGPG